MGSPSSEIFKSGQLPLGSSSWVVEFNYRISRGLFQPQSFCNSVNHTDNQRQSICSINFLQFYKCRKWKFKRKIRLSNNVLKYSHKNNFGKNEVLRFWANTASPFCELAGREKERSIKTWITPAECNPQQSPSH